MEYMKNKLLNDHGEDWAYIPKLGITLDEEDLKPKVPVYPPISQYIKEEKVDERKFMQNSLSNDISFLIRSVDSIRYNPKILWP